MHEIPEPQDVPASPALQEDDPARDHPAVTGFDIDLFPTGDEGSAFRTQNDPTDPYQRQNVIERKGAVDIRCSCVDVVHGFLSPAAEAYCTLLVLQFNFDPRKRSRRIASVHIELRFSGDSPGAPEPEVYDISPKGREGMSITSQHESHTVGGELHVGSGGMAGVDAGGSMKIGGTIDRERKYATMVTGSVDLRGRNWGKANCASWTLLENPAVQTGLPALMKAAVLLKRRDEEKFRCDFTIKAKADWRSSMESMFGSTPADDPVLFDPTLDPTTAIYDEMNLGAVDIKSISYIQDVI